MTGTASSLLHACHYRQYVPLYQRQLLEPCSAQWSVQGQGWESH